MAPTGISHSLLGADDTIKVKDIAKKHSEAKEKDNNVPALVKLAAGNSTTKTTPSTMVNITEDGDIVLKPATPFVSSTSTIQNYYIAKAQKDEFNKLLMRKTCSCSQPECKAILKQYYDDITAPYPGYTKCSNSTSSSNKNKDICKPVPKQLLIPIPNPSKMKQILKRNMNTQIYNRAISALDIPNGESRSDIYVAIHHYPREVIERYQLTEYKGNTKFKDCLLPSTLVETLDSGSNELYSEEDKFNCLGTNAESSDCKKQNVCSCNVYINIPCISVQQAKEQLGKKVNITPQDLLNEPEKAVIVAKVDGHGTKTYKGLPKMDEQIIDGVMMKSCRGCKGYKSKEQYKKREWDKKAGLERECKTCEDVDKMISNVNKKQSPTKNLKTEKRKITGDEWKNEKKTHQMFEVIVPGGVSPGQTFSLVADGQRATLICPQTAKSGGKVRFQLPIPEEGSAAASSPKTKAQDTFEVVVPEGVKAGESFSLLADGQKVTLMCPEGKGGGDTVRFQLPMASAVVPETKKCKTCKESKPEAAFSKGNWNHSATGDCKACVMKEINRIDQMSARVLRSKLVSLQDDTETWKSKYQKCVIERNAARSLNYKLEQKLKKAERDVKALTNHLTKAVKKLGEDMPDLSGKKRSRDSSGDDDDSSPKKRRHDLNADGSARVRRRAKKNKDGTMTPASEPKLLEDGTYAKPGSKAPKGYAWCTETGLWVPESGTLGSVNMQPPYEEDV